MVRTSEEGEIKSLSESQDSITIYEITQDFGNELR